MMRVAKLLGPLKGVRGIYYGWWMSGLAALILALSSVPLFGGMSVWNPVLRGKFGWTPAQLQWAFAFTRIEGGLMGPLEGMLIERLGSRRMVLIGLLVLGAGFFIFSRIHELWQLYGVFFLMSMGAALGTWLPMMTALNHWFVNKRVRAMGLAMEGFAAGGIVLLPLMAWAIGGIEGGQPERFGWRATAAGIGVVIMLLAFPISRLVRNRPEEYGYLPDGVAPAPNAEGVDRPQESPPKAGGIGLTWQEAIRTRNFWLISFGLAFSLVGTTTVAVHLGLLLDDRGFSLQTVGWVAATQTGVNAAFIMVGGYIGDRVPIRYGIFWFSAIQAASIIVLLLADSVPIALLFAVILGIGWGGRTSMSAAIRGIYFGRRAFAAITGISMVPMNVFLFIGPLFAGYMYRFTGSYTVPFIIIAIASFLGSALFLLLGEPKTSLDSAKAVERNAD